MKFNREALLKATDAAIQQLHDYAAHRHAEAVKDYQERVAEFALRDGERWMTATRAIQRKLRKGEPIRESDIPESSNRYGRHAFFGVTEPKFRHEPPKVLADLRTIVSAMADDVVTSAALIDLGANKDALRSAVGHLAPGTVWR